MADQTPKNKAKFNLIQSLCTDGIDQIVYPFNSSAKHLQFNGIEREEGITNLYEKKVTLGTITGKSFFAADNGSIIGSSISGNDNTISVDGNTVAKVSAYGVGARQSAYNSDDIFLTADNSYVTVKYSNGSITLTEFNVDTGNQLNTRATTFAGLANVVATSINVIRYNGMHFADQQKYDVRLGTQLFLYDEANPNYVSTRFGNLTPYYITASIVWNNYTVFGTIDGRIFSVDVNGNYQFPDGSGKGTGPFNNQTVVGTNQINALAIFNNWLIVGANGGLLGSFDGASWKNYDGSGTGLGIFSNAIVVGTNNIAAMIQYLQAQNTTVLCVANTAHALAGKYFTISTYNTNYYFWFYDGTGSDPALAGYTGVQVTLANNDANTAVATKLSAAINSIFNIPFQSVVATATVTIENCLHPELNVVINPSAGTSGFTVTQIHPPGVCLVVAGNTATPNNGLIGFYNLNLGTWTAAGAGSSTITLNIGSGAYAAIINSQAIQTLATITLPQISTTTFAADTAGNQAGKYWTLPIFGQGYYIWYSTGASVDPAPFVGWIGVKIVYTSGATAATLAGLTKTALDALAGNPVTTTIASNVLTIKNNVVGLTNPNTTGTMVGFSVAQPGLSDYYLALGCTAGVVATFHGENWNLYNATGHGNTAFCASAADVVNSQNINASCIYTTFYCVGANTGLVASYDGTNWKTYNGGGTGTGPNSNQGLVGTSNITSMIEGDINSAKYLIVCAVGRMGTFNGTVYSPYSGATTDGLVINQTIIGTQTITSSIVYGNYLVIGGTNGYIGSFDTVNGFWKGYNGGSNGTSLGPFNNGSAVNNQTILKLLVIGTKLIVVTAAYVASYDGSNWKNYDGSGIGTGPANNNTLIGQIYDACVYGTTLILLGLSGQGGYSYPTIYVSSIDNSNNVKRWDGGGTGTGPATSFTAPYYNYGGGGFVTVTWDSLTLYGMKCTTVGSILHIGRTFHAHATVLQNVTNGYWDQIFEVNTDFMSFDGTNWQYPDGRGTGIGNYCQYIYASTTREGSGVVVDLGNVNIIPSSNYIVDLLSTWNGMLLVFGNDGINFQIVSSLNGSNWKYYNGSGLGTGPFNYGTNLFPSLPSNKIVNAVDYVPVATHYLVIGNSIKGVASWDGSAWKAADGTLTGTGPFNAGMVINNQPIGTLAAVTWSAVNYLVVGGGPDYLGNWNGSIWQSYNVFITGTNNLPHKFAFQALDYGPTTQINIWNNQWIFTGGSNGIFSYSIVNNQYERVYNNKNIPASFFGLASNLQPVVTQYGQYLIYTLALTATGSYVNSFDGVAWRFWDGTGLGTGPWGVNDGSNKKCGFGAVVQSATYGPFGATLTTTAQINVAISYNGWLCLAGNLGHVCSFDGSLWKASDGSGSGVGLFSNTPSTFINGQNILSGAVYGSAIAFGAASGYLASFIGTTSTNYNASGTGSSVLAGNATNPITSAAIYAMINYSFGGVNYLIIAGGTGTSSYLASWNGTAWIAYNATGTGVYALALNGYVAQDIKSLCQHGQFLVCGLNAGLQITFDPYPATAPSSNNYTWVNNAGTIANSGAVSNAPFNNATAIGSNNTSQISSYQGLLMWLSTTGRLASWDGLMVTPFDGSKGAWHNYDGTGAGTGIYEKGSIQIGLGTIPINYLFNNIQYFNGPISQFNVLNNNIIFNKASNGFIFDLPQTRYAQVFAYRFGQGTILYGIANNAESIFYAVDASGEISIMSARFARIQTSNGFVRALLTGLPITYGNYISAIGVLGYNSFTSIFSGFESYYSFSTPGPIVLQSNIGAGQVDITFNNSASKPSGNVFAYWAPQFVSVQTAALSVQQSNTNTLIGAYGKLSNAFGVASTTSFEFRAVSFNGSQAFLSAALIGSANDQLGVMLTNLGEYDPNYMPQIISDSVITYKYNNVYYVIKISTTPSNIIQRVGESIYKINTLSPNSLLNIETKILHISSCDYNGRAIFSSTATITTVAHFFDANFQGLYSNSIDQGNKLIYINPLNSINFSIPGYQITGTTLNYEIDVYYDNLYLSSAFNDGSKLVNPNMLITIAGITQGQSYAAATILGGVSVVPFAQGYIYSNKTLATQIETIFLLTDYNSGLVNGVVPVYDGYGLGNQITGIFQNFLVYAQNYLFDGRYIYSININNNVLTNKYKVAEAYGMQFISQSPRVAYFLSAFDNSIFVFDGNYELSKLQRFNKLDNFTIGVFGDRDNSLLMINDQQLVWVRDKIISANNLEASQENLKLYNTNNGIIIIGNDGVNWYSWQYSYEPIGNVVPLIWQSGYYGITMNEKCALSSIMVTIYSRAKEHMSIKALLHSIDETGESVTNPAKIYDIKPIDWSKNGVNHIRLQPINQKALGHSLELDFDSKKVTILDVTAQYVDDSQAIVAEKRTN